MNFLKTSPSRCADLCTFVQTVILTVQDSPGSGVQTFFVVIAGVCLWRHAFVARRVEILLASASVAQPNTGLLSLRGGGAPAPRPVNFWPSSLSPGFAVVFGGELQLLTQLEFWWHSSSAVFNLR